MSDNILDVNKEVDKALHKCQFCGKELCSKSSLNYHQKTAKYCLEIQGKEADIKYICSKCNKCFILKNKYNMHINKCEILPQKLEDLEKKYTELEKEKIDTKKDNENLKNMNNHLQKTIDSLKEKENRYEKEIDDYKTQIFELQKTISEIALNKSRPSKTTTTNNIKATINNLQTFSYNDLKKCSDVLTVDHLKKGVEGHFEVLMGVIKDKVVCTDTARKSIIYKNDDTVVKDSECKGIIQNYSQMIEPKNSQLTKEHQKMITSKLETSSISLTPMLLEEGVKVLKLNDEIKNTAKGMDTNFSTKLSKKIAMATVPRLTCYEVEQEEGQEVDEIDEVEGDINEDEVEQDVKHTKKIIYITKTQTSDSYIDLEGEIIEELESSSEDDY